MEGGDKRASRRSGAAARKGLVERRRVMMLRDRSGVGNCGWPMSMPMSMSCWLFATDQRPQRPARGTRGKAAIACVQLDRIARATRSCVEFCMGYLTAGLEGKGPRGEPWSSVCGGQTLCFEGFENATHVQKERVNRGPAKIRRRLSRARRLASTFASPIGSRRLSIKTGER